MPHFIGSYTFTDKDIKHPMVCCLLGKYMLVGGIHLTYMECIYVHAELDPEKMVKTKQSNFSEVKSSFIQSGD